MNFVAKREMFSSLASYIWSSSSEDQTVPGISDENVVEERGEDEWILVDFVNKKSGMTPKNAMLRLH